MSFPTFHDKNGVRYQLIKSIPGNTQHNWLFFPGGPGIDACYYFDLLSQLNMPGNYWLIDYPHNGSNIDGEYAADYDFEFWHTCLIDLLSSFENPVYIGHSFGGMFPLLYPELESLLKGMVILNATPCLWHEEASKYVEKYNLPRLEGSLEPFLTNPNPETATTALLACAPYYFRPDYLEQGEDMLRRVPFNYFAAVWWLNKTQAINYNAKWAPQQLPTMIIGSSQDYITPATLFEKDPRFDRDNIHIERVENAGHFPWIDQPAVMSKLFDQFSVRLSEL